MLLLRPRTSHDVVRHGRNLSGEGGAFRLCLASFRKGKDCVSRLRQSRSLFSNLLMQHWAHDLQRGGHDAVENVESASASLDAHACNSSVRR
jgi:hypothetical protein